MFLCLSHSYLCTVLCILPPTGKAFLLLSILILDGPLTLFFILSFKLVSIVFFSSSLVYFSCLFLISRIVYHFLLFFLFLLFVFSLSSVLLLTYLSSEYLFITIVTMIVNNNWRQCISIITIKDNTYYWRIRANTQQQRCTYCTQYVPFNKLNYIISLNFAVAFHFDNPSYGVCIIFIFSFFNYFILFFKS